MLAIAILLIFVGFLDLGFLAFEILLFLMIGMLGFIIPNTTTLAMARFKQNSGSASDSYPLAGRRKGTADKRGGSLPLSYGGG